jgi:hypothetical protein
LYYNVGSISNGYPGQDLALVVSTEVRDLNLSEVVDGAPSRAPSGIVTGNFTGPTQNIVNGTTPDGLLLPGILGPLGPTMPGIATLNSNGSADGVTLTWTFADTTTTPGTGIAFQGGGTDSCFDFIGRAKPRDAAGNVCVAVPVPFHIWWDREADTSLKADFFPGNPYPTVTWSKPLPDKGLLAPPSASSFAIWASDTRGMGGKLGTYSLLQSWSSWNAAQWGISAETFANMAKSSINWGDRYFLIVAAVMDESGNVTPWPGELGLNADGSVTVATETAVNKNWATFYIGGRSGGLNTNLSVTIGYRMPDGSTQMLGSNPIIPYPTAPGALIFAQFTIDIGEVDRTLYQNSKVELELEENGNRVWADDPVMNGSRQITFTLPKEGDEFQRFGNPAQNMLANYVFRATHVATDQTGFEVRDSTPASFAFKVIPGTLQEYLKSTRGEQPVKSFENQ